MKNIFAGYYRPSEEEFSNLWQKALFVLDTNVLLDLYRYSKGTREQFFQILHKIDDRLWIPHQVALEFQENRLGVIKDQKDIYKRLSDAVERAEDEFNAILKPEHPSIDKQKYLGLFSSAATQIRDELDKDKVAHPDLSSKDFILDEITSLFADDSKVGKPFSQEKIAEITKQGAKRFENEVPPGYKDSKTKKGVQRFGTLVIEERYGDLILWLQIVDRAKESSTPMIFITSERKEDWWWINKQDEVIGPRPELRTEILNEANIMFYIYSATRFVSFAEKYLGTPITDEAISEVKTISEVRTESDEWKFDWKEQIVSALRASGSEATLSEIYAKIQDYALTTKTELPDSWKSIIRRTLQNYSSDSEWYLGKQDLFAHIDRGVWTLRTLVESSDLSREWLAELRRKVVTKNPTLHYGEAKYYAFFKSAEKARNVVQINPRKTHIRVFTRLDPSLDNELRPTLSSSNWAELYPSMFPIQSEDDIDKAVELIEMSYKSDLAL